MDYGVGVVRGTVPKTFYIHFFDQPFTLADGQGAFLSEAELRGQLRGLGLVQKEIDDKLKMACATPV